MVLQLSSRYKYIVQTLPVIRLTSDYHLHVLKINWAMFQKKFSIWRGISWENYASKFATIVSKLHEPAADCLVQTANQNTNIVAEGTLLGKEHPVWM